MIHCTHNRVLRITFAIAVIPMLTACSQSSRNAEQIIAKQLRSLTPALNKKGLSAGNPVFIRIFKQEHELEVWLKKDQRFTHFKTYPIAKYSGTLGPKLREGDRQAPEGFYSVTQSQMNPNSRYHLSFNIGYPNNYDRALGRTGSLIMVHGSNVSVGCYAMTDPYIEEIYTLADAALGNGQSAFSVHCFPFRMTEENINAHAGTKWRPFWKNLKDPYDWFEKHRIPPNVGVKNNMYHITDESK